LYMQFHGIAFMRPYKQSGWWQEVLLFTHYVLHKPHKKKSSEVRLSFWITMVALSSLLPTNIWFKCTLHIVM